MKINLRYISISCLLIIAGTACNKFFPESPLPDSVMDAPLHGLSAEQNKVFLEGANAFDRVFVAGDGLGPLYVANSCGSCHGNDNRGGLNTILTRFGQTDSTDNTFLAQGGPQLQHYSIPGYQPESLPVGATSSRFIAPIVAGSGYLELVDEADIWKMSDPNDTDGDGISGVPQLNTVPSWVNPKGKTINGKYLCRFGRKASAYNLFQQTVNAYQQDMGITSTFAPMNATNATSGTQVIATGNSEISNNEINANVFYLRTLQAPIQRNINDPIAVRGQYIFTVIGCEKCHKATLKTGASAIEVLNQVTFAPYTDLLLHDMGQELDDHYTEGSALSSEWRTTPLWGLGLAKKAVGGYFLMHDGRARSIEDAIILHGGEGNSSRNNFKKLPKSDKEALINFLESL